MAAIDYIVIDDVIDENTKSPDMEKVKRLYTELVEAGVIPEVKLIEIDADHRLIDPDVQSAGPD